MTYSIGFRSPSFQELGEAFLQFMADSIDLPGRYADPDLEAGQEPGRDPAPHAGQLTEELNKVRWDEEDVTIFLGEYMSEPKHNVFFTGPAKPLTVGRFMRGGRQARPVAVAQDADAVPRQARLHQRRIVRRRPRRQGTCWTCWPTARP
jgi:hypothetical protein